MTNHDPLCPLYEPCDVEEPSHLNSSMRQINFYINCQPFCVCELITKARADEREKVQQRIKASLDIVDGLSWLHPRIALEVERHVIAAVRGES